MPYIDVTTANEELRKIRLSLKPLHDNYAMGFCEAIKQLNMLPNADVVPREEVEALQRRYDLAVAEREAETKLPCVAYNKKHERYQVIHNGKQGHIFASKMYRNRREAEVALAELKKKYTEDSTDGKRTDR